MGCRDGTPGILSDAELLQQQDLLGQSYAHLVQVERLVQSGLHLIVLSTDADVEVVLLEPYAKNLEIVNPTRTANLLRLATVALERHIEDRTGQTFNDYLFTHGLQVSQDFADLSAILGTTINPVNIA